MASSERPNSALSSSVRDVIVDGHGVGDRHTKWYIVHDSPFWILKNAFKMIR